MAKTSFIESLKLEQPQLWLTIVSAAQEGLIVIDEENDAVSATNRLLLTYPQLHEVLAFINDQWTEEKLKENSALSDLLQSIPQKN